MMLKAMLEHLIHQLLQLFSGDTFVSVLQITRGGDSNCQLSQQPCLMIPATSSILHMLK